MDKEIKGQASKEQIDAWKNKYGKICEIEVTDGQDTYKVYFKRCDMKTLSAVNQISKTDEVEAMDVLYKNCLIGGSEEVENDVALKMAATTQLSGLIGQASASLKNL
jgi:hypothetical protein